MNTEQHSIYDMRRPEDRQALTELKEQSTSLRVHDFIEDQLKDLVETRHPSRSMDELEIQMLIKEEVRSADLDGYGTWVYYPWSNSMVHLLYEEDFIFMRTDRNQHKITKAEQEVLSGACLGLVGLSVGHAVAMALALERSFSELRVADFDVLDLSNLNRIRSGVDKIGLAKTEIVQREIAEIDPFLKVTCYNQGLTHENMDEFMSGLDLLIDECDSIDIKISMREKAREMKIPVIMETSDRGMLDIERFDLSPQRPLLHGLVEGLDSELLSGLSNEEKIPYVMQILQIDKMSERMRSSLKRIKVDISTWPQLGADVIAGGGRVASAVRQILLGQHRESGRYYHDSIDRMGQTELRAHGVSR